MTNERCYIGPDVTRNDVLHRARCYIIEVLQGEAAARPIVPVGSVSYNRGKWRTNFEHCSEFWQEA